MRRTWNVLLLALGVVSASGTNAAAQENGRTLPLLPSAPTSFVTSDLTRDAPEGPERAGEFEDSIETDRDSFTPSTRTAGKCRWIVESSYSFIDNRGTPERHSFPELLLRYGAADRIELRLGANYEVGGGGSSVTGVEGGEDFEGAGVERESRVLYGLKVQLSEQERWMPESSVLVQGFTPTSGPGTDTHVQAAYVFGWELAERWIFDSAIRYGTASEEDDRFGVWAPSTVVKVLLGERLNAHAEWFSLYSRNRETDFVRHFFSPGVHYLITPDLEVGVRVGWGLNDQSSRFFSNVGVGWRY